VRAEEILGYFENNPSNIGVSDPSCLRTAKLSAYSQTAHPQFRLSAFERMVAIQRRFDAASAGS
jgi:hypothetical protein